MKEYIERERLKEAFHADLQSLQSVDEHTMNLILIEIDEAPTADVAPVRHGRWIKLPDPVGVQSADLRLKDMNPHADAI